MLMEGLFLFSKCLCSQRQAVDLSFHVFVFPALTLRALLFPVIVASTFFLTSCITLLLGSLMAMLTGSLKLFIK